MILLVLSFIILFYLVDSSASSPAPYLSALPVPDCRVDALENVQNKWRPVIADDFSRVRRSLSLACNEYHHFFFIMTPGLKRAGWGIPCCRSVFREAITLTAIAIAIFSITGRTMSHKSITFLGLSIAIFTLSCAALVWQWLDKSDDTFRCSGDLSIYQDNVSLPLIKGRLSITFEPGERIYSHGRYLAPANGKGGAASFYLF